MNDLIPVLIQKGDRVFDDALYLFSARKSYDSSVSRAYYALFYFTEAILLTKDILVNSHQGVNVMFAKHFVREGLFEVEYGAIVANVFRKRQVSDYDLTTEISEGMAREVLDDVSRFLARGRVYLQEAGY
jgi:uncharacterized protein (UPF0332 family)